MNGLGIYKVIYQDKALCKNVIQIEAYGYLGALITALERKKADEKLLIVQYLRPKLSCRK